MPWCSNIPLQSFHRLIFVLKKSHGDGGVVMYTDLTSYISINGYQESYPNIIVVSSMTEIDPIGDSWVWILSFVGDQN